MSRAALIQFYEENLEPLHPRTVAIRFDNVLVFQWVDGVPQSFTFGFHSQYVPQMIEIWFDDMPVYGLHPPTNRVYLNALPFADREKLDIEPSIVSQLVTYFPQSNFTDDKTEF
jgi:hypothetical protein